MRTPIKYPHPDTQYDTHPQTGAALYAWEQAAGPAAYRPFYICIKVILPKPKRKGRRTFYLTWIIEEQRMARSRDAMLLDSVGLLEWAAGVMAEAFPSLEATHGYNAEEAAAARAAFREEYDRNADKRAARKAAIEAKRAARSA